MAYTIKQVRRLAELSQDEMAKAMGYTTRDPYRRIEKHPEKATVAQIKKICEITGIPISMITINGAPIA